MINGSIYILCFPYFIKLKFWKEKQNISLHSNLNNIAPETEWKYFAVLLQIWVIGIKSRLQQRLLWITVGLFFIWRKYLVLAFTKSWFFVFCFFFLHLLTSLYSTSTRSSLDINLTFNTTYLHTANIGLQQVWSPAPNLSEYQH